MFPIPLAGLAAGLSAAQAVFGLGTGLFQLGKGLFGKKKRPTYRIPESYKELVKSTAFEAAKTGGSSYYEKEANRMAASGVRDIQQSGVSQSGILAAIASMNQQRQESGESVAEYYDQLRRENQKTYQSALKLMGEQEAIRDQYNIYDPYAQYQASQSALTGSGLTNIFQNLGNLSTTVGLAEKAGIWQGGNKVNSGTNQSGSGNIPIQNADPNAPLYAMNTGRSMSVPNQQYQVTADFDKIRGELRNIYGYNLSDNEISQLYPNIKRV